jgi:dienelactone hydrolase
MTDVAAPRDYLLTRLAAVTTAFLLCAGVAAAQQPGGQLPGCRQDKSVSAAIQPLVAPWVAPGGAKTTAGRGTSVRDVDIPTQRGRIAGTLTLPEGLPRPPIVLILHGYTGDRNETPVNQTRERMFQRTGRLLGEMGLATLRFDFINSGASAGRWQDTTFSGQALDVGAVLDYVGHDAEVDQQRIGLLGYSQGGLVALKVVARERRVGAVVLWNPVLDPERTYGQLLTPVTVQHGYDMYRDHNLTRIVDASRLEPAFMFEVKTTYPIADGASFAGPMLVVGGRRDNVAGPVDELAGLLARVRGGRRTEIIMVDGDHGFDDARTPVFLDQAIGCSGQFFARVFRAG